MMIPCRLCRGDPKSPLAASPTIILAMDAVHRSWIQFALCLVPLPSSVNAALAQVIRAPRLGSHRSLPVRSFRSRRDIHQCGKRVKRVLHRCNTRNITESSARGPDTGCHVSALLQCLRVRSKYDRRLIVSTFSVLSLNRRLSRLCVHNQRLVMSQGQDSHTLNRHEPHIRTLKAGYRSHGLVSLTPAHLPPDTKHIRLLNRIPNSILGLCLPGGMPAAARAVKAPIRPHRYPEHPRL